LNQLIYFISKDDEKIFQKETSLSGDYETIANNRKQILLFPKLVLKATKKSADFLQLSQARKKPTVHRIYSIWSSLEDEFDTSNGKLPEV